jgi:hypothetical protein
MQGNGRIGKTPPGNKHGKTEQNQNSHLLHVYPPMVKGPDSTDKCNLAAFGKNPSRGFETQALHWH